MLSRRGLLQGAAALATIPLGSRAFANAGPTTLVVGFPPGGGPDTIARVIADQVRTQGTSMLVDNKVGAGGRIALEHVKRAAPDGRTLCLTPGAMLNIYPHVYSKLSYSKDDFTPIANVAAYSLALVVPVESGHKTLQDLLEWCRKNPGGATYATPGLGNDTNILGWQMSKLAGIQMQPIPYQGGPQLTQAVLGRQVTCAINITSNFSELHRSGKVRILALSSSRRSARLPDVPTFGELGMSECQTEEWLGVVGPRGLSSDQVKSIATLILAAARDPAVQKTIVDRDHIPMPEDAQQFARSLEETYERRGKQVAAAGFKLE